MKFSSLGFIAALALVTLAPVTAMAAGGPSVEAGKRIYLEKKNKCAMCHGDDGRAQTKMGKKDQIADMTTAAWQSKFSDDQIKAAILKGVDREENGRKLKMKPMDGATEDDAKSLLMFIRSLKVDAKAAPKPEGDKKAPPPGADKKPPAPKDAQPPKR